MASQPSTISDVLMNSGSPEQLAQAITAAIEKLPPEKKAELRKEWIQAAMKSLH